MRKALPVFVFIMCVVISGCVISGKVTDNGMPLSGITVKLDGPIKASATTDSNGEYKFNAFKNGEYRVMPVSGVHAFQPAVQVVALSNPFANKTGIDFTSAPVQKSALVLVNSQSQSFSDFEHYIEPYLKNFGVAYTVVDLANENLTQDIERFDVIIIGHRSLDASGSLLSSQEQTHITNAVNSGSGLVNFDDNISTADGSDTVVIGCGDSEHQDPVVTVKDLLVPDDNLWGNFKFNRPFYTVFAHSGETVPTMRFHAENIPNGSYKVYGTVYTSYGNCTYYYGFSASNPTEKSIYTIRNNSSQINEHTEYNLGNINITNGNFSLYVKQAQYDSLSYYWGWAKIRLVPESSAAAEGRYDFINDIFGFTYNSPSSLGDVKFINTSHYITSLHTLNSSIGTGFMTVGGFSVPAGNDAAVLARSGDTVPFLVARSIGNGRAVQFGSGSWFTKAVKGTVFGLDDLVWRSIVWAARKPFAMQCLPNFLTMRVDDTSGPLSWADTAVNKGIKPYIAFFLEDIDASEDESEHLASLVNSGQATANVHALASDSKFYWDGSTYMPWSNLKMSMLYSEADAWHSKYDVPVGRSLVPHYYELGSTSLQGLVNRGIEYLIIQMKPNLAYGQPWLIAGPYRLYEYGASSEALPVYYADYMSLPEYPDFDNKFFVCVTEIRDDAGYEWAPDNDVNASVGRGTRQLKRAFDSRVLATLFTHEQYISAIDSTNWNAILNGVLANVSGYNPVFVTYDEACDYIRSIHDSDINSAIFDKTSGILALTLTGETNVATKVFVYTEEDGNIVEAQADVPQFSGQTGVNISIAE